MLRKTCCIQNHTEHTEEESESHHTSALSEETLVESQKDVEVYRCEQTEDNISTIQTCESSLREKNNNVKI